MWVSILNSLSAIYYHCSSSLLVIDLFFNNSQLLGQVSQDSLATLSLYEIVDDRSLNDFKSVFNKLVHSNPQQAKELIPVSYKGSVSNFLLSISNTLIFFFSIKVHHCFQNRRIYFFRFFYYFILKNIGVRFDIFRFYFSEPNVFLCSIAVYSKNYWSSAIF